jgi:hypothetical protein
MGIIGCVMLVNYFFFVVVKFLSIFSAKQCNSDNDSGTWHFTTAKNMVFNILQHADEQSEIPGMSVLEIYCVDSNPALPLTF